MGTICAVEQWMTLVSVHIFFISISVLDCSPILSTFQVILLEHIIMCRLVTGHKATALQEVYCFFYHGYRLSW